MKTSQAKYKPTTNKVYKIDQSGKIEYTSHNTVVAFSNSKKRAILLKTQDKRDLQKHFREAGKSQVFVFRLFALLIFLLLKDEVFEELIIDIEYPGKGDLIKNYLLDDFRKIGRKIDPGKIRFHSVGKSCEAHWHGFYVFKGKRKAEVKVTSRQILAEIYH